MALSKHKTGYRLLIAIFDSVDDTVLVKKAIVSTLASNLKDIAKDHWGNMVSFTVVLYYFILFCFINGYLIKRIVILIFIIFYFIVLAFLKSRLS